MAQLVAAELNQKFPRAWEGGLVIAAKRLAFATVGAVPRSRGVATSISAVLAASPQLSNTTAANKRRTRR